MNNNVILIIVLLLLLVYYKIVLNDKTIDKFSNSNINNIDVVYVINLDHRLDRLFDFLLEMKKINFPFNKIVRISGVYKRNEGHLGCSLSHIKALEHFISSEYNNCIIFEDDFQFTKSTEEINEVFNNFFNNNINYDVCMLSSNTFDSRETKYPFLKKIIRCATASGYMVSQKFANTLLANFKKGAKLLEKMYNKEIEYDDHCIDQYWKHIQPDSNWFVFEPTIGKQRGSYSDIMNGNVDYNL